MNAYSLAEEADVGLTFGSTIGLEMAMLGKPVLLASRGPVRVWVTDFDCALQGIIARNAGEMSAGFH